MPWMRKRRAGAGKKKAPRRMFGAKRRGYKAVNLVGNSMNPIPHKMIASHKYCETVEVALSSQTIGQYNFNLNSTFDPNRSGIGHQPYGRDTYALLYNRYRVLGVKWNASVINSNAGITTQLTGIPANEVLTGITTNAYAREIPRAKYIIQSPAGAGGPLKNLRGYTKISSLMGLTDKQYRANENAQAQNGADPIEAAILNLFVGSAVDSSATFTGYLVIEMIYIVEWFDPKHLDQS